MRHTLSLLVKSSVLCALCYSTLSFAFEPDNQFLISKQLSSIDALMDASTNKKNKSIKTDKNGKTNLMVAAEYGFKDALEYLIASGANVTQKDKEGHTALFYALSKMEQRGSNDIVVALLSAWEDNIKNKSHGINESDPTLGMNPLTCAAFIGDVELVNKLIEKGANINQLDALGETALMKAVNTGNIEIVKALVKKGANIHQVGRTGRTALHQAAFADKPIVIPYLLSKGADINHVDAQGLTPLMDAVERSHYQVVELLLNRGAKINQTDQAGFTALTWAVRNHQSNKEVISLLLEKGANPDQADDQGRTPLMWSLHDKEAMDLLLAKGADINKIDMDGNSILMAAVHNVHTDTIKFLLSKGANTKLKDRYGRTAKQIAIQNRLQEITVLLSDQKS